MRLKFLRTLVFSLGFRGQSMILDKLPDNQAAIADGKLTRLLDRRMLAQISTAPWPSGNRPRCHAACLLAAVCGCRRCQKCSPQASRQRSHALARTAVAGLRGLPLAARSSPHRQTWRSRSLRRVRAGAPARVDGRRRETAYVLRTELTSYKNSTLASYNQRIIGQNDRSMRKKNVRLHSSVGRSLEFSDLAITEK